MHGIYFNALRRTRTKQVSLIHNYGRTVNYSWK